MRQSRLVMLLLCIFVFMQACTYSEFGESWTGPAVKTKTACPPQIGTGYRVGSVEFIPIGKWEWTDLNGVKHIENVYIKWDLKNKKVGVK